MSCIPLHSFAGCKGGKKAKVDENVSSAEAVKRAKKELKNMEKKKKEVEEEEEEEPVAAS